jgi:hypothetical protein
LSTADPTVGGGSFDPAVVIAAFATDYSSDRTTACDQVSKDVQTPRDVRPMRETASVREYTSIENNPQYLKNSNANKEKDSFLYGETSPQGLNNPDPNPITIKCPR